MEHYNVMMMGFYGLQDRSTFHRLIVKNNAKKRKMYESFIESVPLLKSLQVREASVQLMLLHWLQVMTRTKYTIQQ